MRKVATLTLIIIIISASWAAACVCADMSKDLARAIYDDADFVIFGRPVAASDPNPRYEKELNDSGKSNDIILQVDSVLKGDVLKGEKIFIYQDSGSCIETYEFGQLYLIAGKRIKKLKKVRVGDDLKSSGEYFPPTTSFNLKAGELEIDADPEYTHIYKYINKRLKKYKTITADMCTSFYADSKSGAEFLAYLKK